MNQILITKKLQFLIIIFVIISLIITVSTLYIVHDKAIDSLTENLYNEALREKSLIKTLHDQGNNEASIIEILKKTNAQRLILGQTGEFVIAKQIKDSVLFLTTKSLNDLTHIKIHIGESNASPMQMALSGKSGSLHGIDYKGQNVYASYIWIKELKWGIVAKITTAEINKPYIEASIIALLLAVILISIVSIIYVQITNPIVESIKETENKFEMLFENSADAIFILDVNANFLDANQTALNRLNYTKEELLKLNSQSINEPDSVPKIKLVMSDLFEKGQLITETNHVTKEGKLIPTEINSRVINYKGVKSVLSVARDITNRREAQNKLIESEKRFHNAIIDAPTPIMIHAQDGQVVLVNTTWSELTGYTQESIPTIFDWTEKAYGLKSSDIKAYIENLYNLKK